MLINLILSYKKVSETIQALELKSKLSIEKFHYIKNNIKIKKESIEKNENDNGKKKNRGLLADRFLNMVTLIQFL